MKAARFSAVLLLGTTVPLFAQWRVPATGQDLWVDYQAYERVSTNAATSIRQAIDDAWGAATYEGFVMGVVETVVVTPQLHARIDLPPDAQPGQFDQVVANYLASYPQSWGDPAATLVIEALIHAFPRS